MRLLSSLIILLVFPLSCAAVVAVVIAASFPRFVLIHAFIADYVGSPLFRDRFAKSWGKWEPNILFLKRDRDRERERASERAAFVLVFGFLPPEPNEVMTAGGGDPTGKPPLGNPHSWKQGESVQQSGFLGSFCRSFRWSVTGDRRRNRNSRTDTRSQRYGHDIVVVSPSTFAGKLLRFRNVRWRNNRTQIVGQETNQLQISGDSQLQNMYFPYLATKNNIIVVYIVKHKVGRTITYVFIHIHILSAQHIQCLVYTNV